MSVTYVRKNDPSERVVIVSQEKCPNGWVSFTMISPSHVENLRKRAHEFFALYNDPTKVVEKPKRPHSNASKAEWMNWALYLENQLEATKPKQKFSVNWFYPPR